MGALFGGGKSNNNNNAAAEAAARAEKKKKRDAYQAALVKRQNMAFYNKTADDTAMAVDLGYQNSAQQRGNDLLGSRLSLFNNTLG